MSIQIGNTRSSARVGRPDPAKIAGFDVTQGSDDPGLGNLVLAIQALRVDAKQDLDSVTSPLVKAASPLCWRGQIGRCMLS
jgi:hypothetical protein